MTEREIFYRHMGLPSFNPVGLEIRRAEGIYLWDQQDNRYLDLVSGIAVCNIGHRHPAVIRAIHEQLDCYLHLNVYGEYIQSPQVKLAKTLTSLLPEKLDSVYFVNSGSEAIEGAMKLAKRYTGRAEVISFINSYHGSTQGALSILGNETMKQAFRPLIPDTSLIRFNQISDLRYITRRTACVIAETIQAEAGIILPDNGFLSRLWQRCRETETLLVIDDVQMGMGRTGTVFSFEQYDVVPDILILAKALGAGMPLGAFIASKPVMDTLSFSPELGHITTFGGHPVCCAAALAGLDILLNGDILDTVEEKGYLFTKRLEGHPAIRAIRRKGMAIGIDLTDPAMRNPFSKIALKEGIIIDWFLFQPATFRIAPPLTITFAEIEDACDRLARGLDQILPR